MRQPPSTPQKATLEARYEHMLQLLIRKRGEQYFRLGRVTIAKVGPEGFAARVTGSTDYLVELVQDKTSGASARVACECPHFRRGSLCKHIWAAILAADAYTAGKAGTGCHLGRRRHVDGRLADT